MILFLPSSVIQEQCTSDFFNRVNRYTLCILNIDFFHFKILAHEIHQEFAQWSSVSEQLWKDVIWLLTSTVTVAKSTAVDFFLPNNSEYCIKWIESVPSYAESSHSGVVVAEKGLGSRHILQSTAPRSCSCRYVYIQTVRAQKQRCDKQSCLLGNAKRCMYS